MIKPRVLQFKDEWDERRYENWSKDDIYEAYVSEHNARVNLEKYAKNLGRDLAKIRYELKRLSNG